MLKILFSTIALNLSTVVFLATSLSSFIFFYLDKAHSTTSINSTQPAGGKSQNTDHASLDSLESDTPLKFDHPRDTMRTFMSAMGDYKAGQEAGDSNRISRLDDAVRCLNLKEIPYLVRQEKGREAAILLKEIIDRLIVVDFDKVPASEGEKRWRLKNTEIVILQEAVGEQAGEFLFSPQTVYRAKSYFNKVKDRPYLSGTTGGAGYRPNWDETYLPSWARARWLGQQKWKWLGLLITIFICFVLKLIGERTFHFGVKFFNQNTETFLHRTLIAFEKPAGLLLAVAFGFVALGILNFDGFMLSASIVVLQIFLSVGLIWAAYRFSDAISFSLKRLAEKTESDLDDHLVPLVSRSIRVFVVLIGTLLTMQNFGFNVMSLLAGLGIGGLAFALAAKDTAANLFGSIMIILDRPFKMGDWIISGAVEGTVEEIGFRSTRLRTFYNSQVSIPNSVLATAHIDNMGRRTHRRLKATLSVVYSTTPKQVERFVNGIRGILRDHPQVRQDNFLVYFTEYADSSLNILLYCHLVAPTWADELEYKQQILMGVMNLASELGVEFAFPTRTVHVDSLPSPASRL